jgi:tripartite-type tricarboxylate transporter receptor subunit TctC
MQIRMLLAALLFQFLAQAAQAQAPSADAWPVKPVRLVLSFPGGAPDILARLIAPKLTDMWGQQVIVDPRSGAGGIVGTDVVAKAPGDGYTFLIASPSHAINPSLYPKLPYDSVADFVGVSKLAEVPNIVIVHPAVPARTLKDLIAYLKANPGKVNYGTSCCGSSQHLAGELFSKMAGVKIIHVPYKSGPQVVIDLVAGQVQLTFGSSSAMPNVRSGKLVALAVTTAQRVSSIPELPTVAEAALPGYEAAAWYAMFAPARTARPIVNRVQADAARALVMPDVREKLTAVAIEPVGSTPAEMDAFLKREIAKWSVVVKESGAKPD